MTASAIARGHSRGRSRHAGTGCRAVNVSKATLEGQFSDEPALLQPTPGYMRLIKESVLQIWKARKTAVREKLDRAQRAAKAVQETLDRRSVPLRTVDQHRDVRSHVEKLREELTLARIDRHSGQLEELDVEGILAFAERVLPSASNLWVQSSLNQKQRLQQLFFPEGVRFDGKRLVGTGLTLPVFNYLTTAEDSKKEMVDQAGIEPATS